MKHYLFTSLPDQFFLLSFFRSLELEINFKVNLYSNTLPQQRNKKYPHGFCLITLYFQYFFQTKTCSTSYVGLRTYSRSTFYFQVFTVTLVLEAFYFPIVFSFSLHSWFTWGGGNTFFFLISVSQQLSCSYYFIY